VSEGARRVKLVKTRTKTDRIEGERANEQSLMNQNRIGEDLSDVGPKSAENIENR
jgi:hypothetical protein